MRSGTSDDSVFVSLTDDVRFLQVQNGRRPMRTMLALLFGGSDRPIDRVTYLRLGVALMLLKYVVDAALIGVIGRRVPDAGRLPAAHAHVQRKEFKTGLAYPLRARLVGAGVGAVRHCEFTTGAFVEPITVWDAPHRLAFDVIAQPPPLQEWSPTRASSPRTSTASSARRTASSNSLRSRADGHGSKAVPGTP